jgi:hypothetical protein
METSASEQEVFETYKAMRAIAVDSLNAAHRSLDFVNKLAPAVCRVSLSEFIPLQAGGDISVGLEYKRLRVPVFLTAALTLARGGFNARPCPAGFEIVQSRTDAVACVLNTSKPLFEVSLEAFKRLAALGQQLIYAHLMKNIPDLNIGSCFCERGFDKVVLEKPRYVESDQRIYINQDCYFADVASDVWEFKIGGYQVLDKYLKERVGRVLSHDEIKHVSAVIKVLGFTIALMKQIDES